MMGYHFDMTDNSDDDGSISVADILNRPTVSQADCCQKINDYSVMPFNSIERRLIVYGANLYNLLIAGEEIDTLALLNYQIAKFQCFYPDRNPDRLSAAAHHGFNQRELIHWTQLQMEVDGEIDG